MVLSDFLIEEAMVEELASVEKEGAIRELVLSLCKADVVKSGDVDSIVEAAMSREQLGSTGIGRGVAVPHGRHPAFKEPVGVFGHSSGGVEFAALDGAPVHAIFLFISPVPALDGHLEGLSLIARLARNENYCRHLRETTGREELIELLRDAQDYVR